jgi:hypothetical protein
MKRFIRIDNQIIEKIGNSGFKVSSIKLFERQNRVKLNLENVPYVSSGSRRLDSIIIQNLTISLVNCRIDFEKNSNYVKIEYLNHNLIFYIPDHHYKSFVLCSLSCYLSLSLT